MEVSSWENHLFLWAIYTMAMLNNQRVSNSVWEFLVAMVPSPWCLRMVSPIGTVASPPLRAVRARAVRAVALRRWSRNWEWRSSCWTCCPSSCPLLPSSVPDIFGATKEHKGFLSLKVEWEILDHHSIFGDEQLKVEHFKRDILSFSACRIKNRTLR